MPCKILSIDGGGIRGLVPATLLSCLEKDTGKRATDLFDVLAGTSTGALLATCLAAGISSDYLVDLYLNKAKLIFKESFIDRLSGVDEYLDANYSNKGLKKELDNALGTTTLGDLAGSSFGKANKHLMVCSFDLNPEPNSDGNRNYRPDVFYSDYRRDADKLLADICLMSAAAPTYFPIYKDHIDGGVAMNNPAMAAVAYALNDQDGDAAAHRPDGKKGLSQSSRDIFLLSLGTGTSNKTYIDPAQIRKGNWGKLKWVNYMPDLLTESNVQSTHYYVEQVLPGKNYVRCNPCFDEPEAPALLRTEDIRLDETNPARLKAMHEFARSYYQRKRKEILSLIGLTEPFV